MTGNVQTLAIMSAGMKILRDTLGILEAEIFITNIKNPWYDYTEWRENLWEDLTLHELLERPPSQKKNMEFRKALHTFEEHHMSINFL